MVRLSPPYKYAPSAPAIVPLQGRGRKKTCLLSGAKSRERRALFRFIRQSSYWVSDANEMAAVKTILIIVNS
jgi:hypothetical protein